MLKISGDVPGPGLGPENVVTLDRDLEEVHVQEEGPEAENVLILGDLEVAAVKGPDQRAPAQEDVLDPNALAQENDPVLGRKVPIQVDILLVGSALHLQDAVAVLGMKEGLVPEVKDPVLGTERSHIEETKKKGNPRPEDPRDLPAKEGLHPGLEARKVVPREGLVHQT